MTDEEYKALIRQQVKSRFKGKKNLACRLSMPYKATQEREYTRIMNAYIRLVKDVIQIHYPEIKAAYSANNGVTGEYHEDDNKGLISALTKIFQKMNAELSVRVDKFDVERKIKALAEQSQKMSVKEWKKAVKQTLGIDISEDYYFGDFFRNQTSTWTSENVGLIKSIPQEALGEMEEIISSGFSAGKTLTGVVREIERTYHVSRSKARFLARDQTAKLNAEISQAQQRAAGCTKYTWRTAGDQRVRDRHEELDKTVHYWDEPPIVDKKTGRRCHPGEDYNCRCVAIPIFDIDTLDLPIEGRR